MKFSGKCGRTLGAFLAAVFFLGPGVVAGSAAEETGLTVQVIGSTVKLQWKAVSGRRYVVERSGNLDGPWQQPGDVTAQGETAMWMDPDTPAPDVRYYRLAWDPDDNGQPGNELFPLPDGGFESGGGPTTAWFQGRPLNNAPLIVPSIPGWNVTPRSGSHFAWLGGYHNLGESPNHRSVIQYGLPILVPAPPVHLHVWYQIISTEQPNHTGLCEEFLNLWFADVLDTGTQCNTNLLWQQFQICQAGNTNGWTRVSVDLSALSGQLICLAFEMRTNFLDLSHVLLDDISFRDAP